MLGRVLAYVNCNSKAPLSYSGALADNAKAYWTHQKAPAALNQRIGS